MAIQIYRKPNDINVYEVGTNRILKPAEFNQALANKNIVEPKPLTSDITRDGAGYAIKSPLANFTGNTKLIELAKEIAAYKNNQNKDLTTSEAYWRNVAGDVNAFGNQAPGRSPIWSDKTDINQREASPEEQSALRLARQGLAASNITAIQNERTARGNIQKESLDSLTDLLKEEASNKTNNLTESTKKIANANALKKAGFKVTAEDYGVSPDQAIGDRIGPSDSWRHMNAGMLKYSEELAKKYGATKGMSDGSGGFYAVFPEETIGEKALKDLIDQGKVDTTSPEFKGTIFGQMSIAPSRMSEDQWKQTYDTIKKNNKWEEGGSVMESSGGEHTFYTDNDIANLAVKFNMDPKILTLKSDTELSKMESEYNHNLTIKIIDKLESNPSRLKETGLSDPQLLTNVIEAISAGLTDEQIIKTLEEDEKILDAATKYQSLKDYLAELVA